MIRTAKKFLHHLSNLSDTLGSAPYAFHHECPHCRQETPWVVQALRGYYRCTRCGRNPLDDDS